MSIFAACDELKLQLDSLRPFPMETLEALHNYYRVGLTYSSNALEGNSLTESETKVVIEDGLTIGGKPLQDIYEAIGHARAYDYLQTMATDKDLTLNDILELHKLFYQQINSEQAGRLRTVPVFLSGSRYSLPSPADVPKLMQKFLAWIGENETKLHPVELAALVHRQFVFIHPFIDGNGRVARLLMSLILLRHGYPITIIPPILHSEYIALLEKSHTDTACFVQFIVRREEETLRELLRLLGHVEKHRHSDMVLSAGAEKSLNFIAANPGVRVPAIMAYSGRSRPAVERYLRELRNAGKVEFRGAPKNGGYFAK